MEPNTLEKAFTDYIEGNEYDRMQNILYDAIHMAFEAGWKSAKSNVCEYPPVVQVVLLKPGDEKP